MIDVRLLRNWKERIANEIVFRGAAGVLVVKGLGAVVAVALQLLLTNVLGAEQYGYYAYALSVFAVALLVSKLGMDMAIVRFIPEYEDRGEWGLIAGVLSRFSVLAVGVSGGIAGMIYLATHHDAVSYMSEDALDAIRVGCLSLPLLTLLAIWQGGLRAFRRVVFATLPRFVMRPVVMGGGFFVLVFFFGRSPHAPLAMMVHVVSIAIALAVAAIWLYKTYRSKVFSREVIPSVEWKAWLTTSVPLLIMSGFQVINTNADILMLGALADTTAAGIYSVAVRVSGALLLGLTAVNAIAAPVISKLYARRDMEALQRTATLAVLAATLFTIPAAFSIFVFREPLLRLFGPEFSSGEVALLLVVVGACFNALFGSVGFFLTMTDHQMRAAAFVGVSAVINITMNAFLIPEWGIEGAALASLVSTMVWNLLMYIEVRRKVCVDPAISSLLNLKT